MDYKKMSLGLGMFSIALGAIELLGSRKVTETLDAEGHEGVVKAFGAREILAGVNLLVAPAVATNMWNRVAGDVMDLAATGFAAKNAPKNKAVWGSLAFVAGALLLDAFVANGLDRTTGKTSPARA